MEIVSIEELAAADLAVRNLKLGEYGLRVLSPEEIAKELGWERFDIALYGIGIPYHESRIGNIRLGSRKEGSKKYLNTPFAKNRVFSVGNKNSNTVIVTEGEFKAMAAHKKCVEEGLDYLIVGLVGVNNWSGRSQSRAMILELETLLKGKDVHVIFDYDGTDISENEFTGLPKNEVLMSERKFCSSLCAIGCNAYFHRIGKFTKGARNEKFALDDYVLMKGEISKLMKYAKKFSIDADDTTIVETTAYAKARFAIWGGSVVDVHTGKRLRNADARIHWGGRLMRPDEDGRQQNPLASFHIGVRSAPRIEEWVFKPEKPYGLIENSEFNLWKPWRKPVEGDVSPWTQFLDLALKGRDEERQYLENWMAYIIQNPGKKNFTYIVLSGEENGSGKSTIANSFINLISPAGIYISGEALFNKNNPYLEGVILVASDEISTDKGKHVNQLKDLVTGTRFTLEEKFISPRDVPNTLNFILTTNEPTAVLVSDKNRRDVIISMPRHGDEGLRQIGKVVAELVKWQENGGYEIMLHHYLNRDISAYDSKARAPRFEGFERAVTASKSDTEFVFDEIVQQILQFEKPFAITPQQLALWVYSVDEKCSPKQIRRRFSKSELYNGTKTIRNEQGVVTNYIVLSAKVLEMDFVYGVEIRDNGTEFMKRLQLQNS